VQPSTVSSIDLDVVYYRPIIAIYLLLTSYTWYTKKKANTKINKVTERLIRKTVRTNWLP